MIVDGTPAPSTQTKRPWRIVAIVAAVAFVAYLIASPYLTLVQLKNAIESNDTDAVSRLVDFPRLRESVKGQLMTAMTANVKKQADSNPFAAAGAGLAMLMVNPMVDGMMTPAGLIAMVKTGRPDASAASSPVADANAVKNLAFVSHYTSFERFAIEIPIPGSRQVRDVLTMRLCRNGLGWQLCDMTFPPSILGQ